MSESKPPKPAQPKFLPRTWKLPEEPAEEPKPGAGKKTGKDKADREAAAQDASTKPKKKKKKADADASPEAGASKLEETPLLDTYEARQKIRYVLGGIISLVAVVAIIILVRAFQPSPAKPDADADRKEARTVVDPKESNEREAGVMVENAKQADKLGQNKNAVILLGKVVRGYDGTEAAKEARAALARESQNRPLFGPDPTKPTGPIAPSGPAGSGPALAATNPPPTTGPVTPAAPVAPTPPPAAPKPPEIVVRPLPNGFRIEPGSAIHASGWPLRIICDRDKAPMVLVPAGEFLMGREDGERQERPSHRVKLAAYYIDEHEVTNRQYQAYLEETGRAAELTRTVAVADAPKALPADRLDYPAAGLTAKEAQAFCYWANRRLPTEAQWELAARSTDGRVSYGTLKDAPKGDTRALEPVMTDPHDRSPLGGYDFAGNAWEWTSDYYDSSYYNQLKDLTVDPTGPAQSRLKPAQAAVKGGSPVGSLTWRRGVAIDTHQSQLGFRGALPVEVQATAAANPAAPGGQAAPPAGGMPF